MEGKMPLLPLRQGFGGQDGADRSVIASRYLPNVYTLNQRRSVVAALRFQVNRLTRRPMANGRRVQAAITDSGPSVQVPTL
jgi:hypothetical protein